MKESSQRTFIGSKELQQYLMDDHKQLEVLIEFGRKVSKNSFQFLIEGEQFGIQFSKAIQKANSTNIPNSNNNQNYNQVQIVGLKSVNTIISDMGAQLQNSSTGNSKELERRFQASTENISRTKQHIMSSVQSLCKSLDEHNTKYNKQIIHCYASQKQYLEQTAQLSTAQQDVKLYYNRAYQLKQELKVIKFKKQLKESIQIAKQLQSAYNSFISSLRNSSLDIIKSLKSMLELQFTSIIDAAIHLVLQRKSLLDICKQSMKSHLVSVMEQQDVKYKDDNQEIIARLRQKGTFKNYSYIKTTTCL